MHIEREIDEMLKITGTEQNCNTREMEKAQYPREACQTSGTEGVKHIVTGSKMSIRVPAYEYPPRARLPGSLNFIHYRPHFHQLFSS